MLLIKNIFLLLITTVISLTTSSQTLGYQWAKNVSTYSVAKGICTDANGNVFKTGFYTGTATFGSTSYTSSGYDVFLAKYDSMGTVLWAKRGIGIGSGENYATSVTTDLAGNVYITGRFSSPTLTFGSTVLNNVEGAGATHADVFIAKYNSSGSFLWAKSAGGFSSGAPFADMGFGISADKSGNVIVAGFFESPTLTFGWNTLYNSVSSGNNPDIFVVKYNASGTDIWAKSYGSVGSDYAWAVDTDSENNILITGSFRSDTLFIGLDTLINTGFGDDVFVSKSDPSGNPIWAKAGAGVMDSYGKSIASDRSGNVIVTGNFNGTSLIFETDTLINNGFDDIFLVKYDSTGSVVWAKNQNGNRADIAYDIATDSLENIIITGAFDGSSLIFGADTLLNTAIWYPDIFIAKFNSSGNELWAKSVGGTTSTSYSDDTGNSICVDTKGNIYAAGYFTGPDITFGSLTLINGSGGYANAYLVRLGMITAGIQSTSFPDTEIFLYPNPCKEKFYVSTSNPHMVIDRIEIIDALGNCIYLKKTNASEQSVTLPDFAPGIYLLQLFSNDYRYTKKLIIQ